jgi:ABC-type iron transport system FetAB permease component
MNFAANCQKRTQPSPWYDPRYAITLLGMILGSCMTGIALGLDTLTTGLMNRRASVEAQAQTMAPLAAR